MKAYNSPNQNEIFLSLNLNKNTMQPLFLNPLPKKPSFFTNLHKFLKTYPKISKVGHLSRG